MSPSLGAKGHPLDINALQRASPRQANDKSTMAKASSSKSGRGSSSSTIASTKRLATDKCTKAGGTYESYRKARVSEHKKVKKASQISLDRQLGE